MVSLFIDGLSMNGFVFGDPQQLAQVYYDSAVSGDGPGLRDKHPDEMSHQELVNQMVYLGIAARNAFKAGQDEVAEVLHGWYDEAFTRLTEADEAFRQRFLTGKMLPLKAGKPRNKGHYLRLAGLRD